MGSADATRWNSHGRSRAPRAPCLPNRALLVLLIALVGGYRAEADTVRAKTGIGYTGSIQGIDASGLILQVGERVIRIPRHDIARIASDASCALERAEGRYACGLTYSGAADVANLLEAEAWYKIALGAGPPPWLQVVIHWRLCSLYAACGRAVEALEEYLAVNAAQPEWTAGLQLPPPPLGDDDSARKMLQTLRTALRTTEGRRSQAALLALRDAIARRENLRGQLATLPTPIPGMLVRLEGDYHAAAGPARPGAADALIRGLLEAGSVKAQQGDLDGADLVCSFALEVAKAEKSPCVVLAESARAHIPTWRALKGRIAELKARLSADPKGLDGRQELINLYLVDLDCPDEALGYALSGVDVALRRKIACATFGLTHLPEKARRELAAWYMELAGGAGPASRTAMLNRARMYESECTLKPRPAGTTAATGRAAGGSADPGPSSGAGQPGAGRPGLFGVGGDEASKIVYVIDRSGSMTDSLAFVRYELKRSIGELGVEKQFHVIFYSSGPALEMPARRLVSATEANKQKAFEFIDGVDAQGETDPSDALQRAFAVGPDLIYLLTDGEFDKCVVDQIRGLNRGGKVTVHTVSILYNTGEEVLKDIASKNHGNYRYVSEADLQALGD